jgi:hypothetical protein
MRHSWLVTFSSLVALAILAGIAWYVVYLAVAAAPPPDAMTVVVTQVYPTPGKPTTVKFSQHFGAPQAQSIYATLRAEPDVTGKPQSCPAISASLPYYHYVLTFAHQGVVSGTATSDGFGCEDIIFTANGAQTIYFWNNRDTSFWDELQQVTGAPVPVYGSAGAGD